jgi:hypothetical protein
MNILVILYLIIAFFIFSCKENNVVNKLDKINYNETRIIFPDTVFLNESNNGWIHYKNDLDTLTIKFNDLEKLRFLYFEYFLTNNPSDNNNEIRKMITDTFVAKNNRIIPLYDIKFDKLGINYFNGIITDEVIIANGGVLKNGKKGDRIITNEIRLIHPVYVKKR